MPAYSDTFDDNDNDDDHHHHYGAAFGGGGAGDGGDAGEPSWFAEIIHAQHTQISQHTTYNA